MVGGPTGAAYGFQIGLAVGTIVSPTQLPGTYGPRLNDARTTTAQIGAPIVELFGTDVTSGHVLHLGPLIEHANTSSQGGKGAPEQDVTSYSYTQDIAIGLCRGPKVGLLRIWENGELVYDRRAQQEGESEDDFHTRILASDNYEFGAPQPGNEWATDVTFKPSNGFTLYLGDETQLPDPTIEETQGVGNVPGYRGLMYIVYPNRNLRDDQGRRHPSFKFEVYEEGEETCITIEEYASEILYPWLGGTGDPSDPRNIYRYQLVNLDLSHPHGDPPPLFVDFDSLDELMGLVDTYKGRAHPYLNTHQVPGISPDATAIQGGPVAGSYTTNSVLLLYNAYPADTIVPYPDFLTMGCADLPYPGDGYQYNAGNVYVGNSITLATGTGPPTPVDDPNYDNTVSCGDELPYRFFRTERDIRIQAWRSPAPPEGYVLDESRDYHVLRKWVDGDLNTLEPLGPVLPVGHASDTQAFWESAYLQAVAIGQMDSGLTYPDDYPGLQSYGYMRTAEICNGAGNAISIAAIVARICERCGLTRIDVSELEDRLVHGYTIQRVMDGRSAIAPLRSVGFFDGVDSGSIYKFPVRGKASVRALTEDDLGAHEIGTDIDANVTTRKQQDIELPRQLFVQYRDPERDYEPGEQSSPTRITTAAVNDVYVDAAVAISATQALRCAEVLWADLWAARWSHQIALDLSQIELEVTDTFTVPVDGRNERMRAVSLEDSGMLLRRFALVRDDDGDYTSTVVAEPSALPVTRLNTYARSLIYFIDLPPLRSQDDNAGFYVAAARGVNGTTWGGATILRSTDDGDTFQNVTSVVSEAIIGTMMTALPAASSTVWDLGNEIIVDVSRGTLSNCTEEEAREGANLLAIGADERWELVSFTTAELIGPTRWRLTHLLRGRRATEHNVGGGLAGDTVILVSGDGIARVPLAVADIAKSFIYRAVTIGTSIATGIDSSFAGHGEALRPFSPVNIKGDRDEDGNLVVSWMRRDRLQLDYVPGEPTLMSEQIEDYEVDILTSTGEVRRTISSSVENIAYSVDQQITDFGSVQASIIVRIYQISVAVGRGHGTQASI